MVEIPVEWIRDDAPYVAMDRMTGARPYGGPAMVADILRRELDVAWEEGGRFQVTMHPPHVGHLVTAVNEKREYTDANERVADSWRKSNRRHQQLEMEGLK